MAYADALEALTFGFAGSTPVRVTDADVTQSVDVTISKIVFSEFESLHQYKYARYRVRSSLQILTC